MVKKIIRFPNPSLKSACKPVDLSAVDRNELLEHIKDLQDTLAATPNGLALASNQILPLGFRIFVVKQPSSLPEVLINPFWQPSSNDQAVISDEGCLSLPEASVRVPRATAVEVVWHDLEGTPRVSEFTGLAAIIVQHECDHLDGKIIYDYADKKTQLNIRRMAIKNRKAGR